MEIKKAIEVLEIEKSVAELELSNGNENFRNFIEAASIAIEALKKELNLTDTVDEIAEDLRSSADECASNYRDLILVEKAIDIVKEYLLPEVME